MGGEGLAMAIGIEESIVAATLRLRLRECSVAGAGITEVIRDTVSREVGAFSPLVPVISWEEKKYRQRRIQRR